MEVSADHFQPMRWIGGFIGQGEQVGCEGGFAEEKSMRCRQAVLVGGRKSAIPCRDKKGEEKEVWYWSSIN